MAFRDLKDKEIKDIMKRIKRMKYINSQENTFIKPTDNEILVVTDGSDEYYKSANKHAERLINGITY